MKKYRLNADLSYEVYQNHKDNIELKMCYNNTFNMVYYYSDKFRKGEWKVAYGYVHVNRNAYARHAFIIDDNGDVVDPTIVATTNYIKGDIKEYFVFHIFDNIDDYFLALEKEHGMPSLEKRFRNLNNKLCAEYLEQQIVLIN